jgi:hypothetical protein
MEETLSPRQSLVIRLEIFGFVFLLALLAGLFSGCGDGPGEEGTDAGRLLDSGTATAPTPVLVGTVDPNHILPPTGTCKIPSASQIGVTLPSPLKYQVATANGLFCTMGEAYMGSKNIDFTKAPFTGLTCQELVSDTPAVIKALGMPNGSMMPGDGCCELTYPEVASVNGKKVSTGYFEVVGVACSVPSPQLSALCSISGTFMGFSCPWTP